MFFLSSNSYFSRSYVCFVISFPIQNSMLDVRCSMFFFSNPFWAKTNRVAYGDKPRPQRIGVAMAFCAGIARFRCYLSTSHRMPLSALHNLHVCFQMSGKAHGCPHLWTPLNRQRMPDQSRSGRCDHPLRSYWRW